ncbi:tRNA(Met) cytidine acetate ligase [Mogibacterium pumilum]|uniref:tRNA(Met) cytidine acetate ligase n=1 Tax=Mogibacterium pumilum TaxID=86332 RepID=A0A223ASM9_9FIRM|nr:nucleotidyltransferase family protein [Mogibacterium pumilum]ASS37981.1 hypothetical protein AXF17_05770 [Mogibacterium pumilum]
MKVLGIVAEYNPLHNGHLYHINKAKQETGADAVIVVLSGDYVQRGELAAANKWIRAESAIKNGIDAVFEIPVYACLSNASVYASTAIKLLAATGVIDVISFGSESGNLKELTEIVYNLNDLRIGERISELSKDGHSYPRARAIAYEELFGSNSDEALSKPNDTLAIEYIKAHSALKNSNIALHTVKRESSGYSAAFDNRMRFQSASGIRQAIRDGIGVSDFMPEDSFQYMKANSAVIRDRIDDNLFNLVRYALLNLSSDEIDEFPQGGEGIGAKLLKAIRISNSIDELIMAAKSKRYTYTRISRLLMQIVLGIKRTDFGEIDPGYFRLLAANETGRKLIRKAKNEELNKLPILTNINREAHKLQIFAKKQLLLDVKAADTYNILAMNDMYKESDRVKSPTLL